MQGWSWPGGVWAGRSRPTRPDTARCQALGFVETGLSGAGGGWLWLFLAVVGVGCPGGFVLGGGSHVDGGVWPDGARLASIFHWLVEWGLVAALPVSWLGLCRLGVTACRVSSRGSRAFPGARGFFLQGRGGQEAGAVCLRSR